MKQLVMVLTALSCIVLGSSRQAECCSAFYATEGEFLLVGNNEDLPESLVQAWGGSHMWYIPPEEGKYGKVCFGWGDLNPYGVGFVQGGMNEAGLFFDYFSTPFYEITESLDKPIYDGVLADKAMDEYSTVEEVVELYTMYNLQAQYFEIYQVMFGDRFGGSAIIEGDSTITRSEWYQVCTNYYQSCPEAGGYPCWRYDMAVEMFESCDEFSTEFCRNVLDAVSSGSTQYSHIYDLKSGVFRLFFHENFEEFIEIDLQDELAKGARSFELTTLFADMRLIAPDESAVLPSPSATFEWSGKPGCDYRLYYSENPDFEGCEPIRWSDASYPAIRTASLCVVFLGFIPLGLIRRRRTPLLSIAIMLAMTTMVVISCDLNGVMENEAEDGMYSMTVDSLEPNTTYYWKLTAQATDDFISESIVRTFTTAS